jgi:hypothetical protein
MIAFGGGIAGRVLRPFSPKHAMLGNVFPCSVHSVVHSGPLQQAWCDLPPPGAPCLGMVLLVAGFIRNIRQGSTGQSQGVPLAEYEYQAADDADESDPCRQP